MDRATIDVYERVARDYARRRPPRSRAEAEAFARRIPGAAVRADLGCGPGTYTAWLGQPVVAFDAADTMLQLVPARASHALRVRGDLEALPFRTGGLGAAWANLSYQHLPAVRLPLALAELHRALALDAPAELTVLARPDEPAAADDDFPGRLQVRWEAEEMRRLLTGAGFAVGAIGQDTDQLRARLTRSRTLADTVGPDIRLLICGLNPSLYAADAGVPFARPGNRFWPAARQAGLTSVDRDAPLALQRDGIGFTDLVKRATIAAGELSASEYVAGLGRVRWLVEWLRPGAVCFVGLSGWRAAVDRHAVAGRQHGDFAGAPAYVMPSTSGLNARTSLAELVEHLGAARSLAPSS